MAPTFAKASVNKVGKSLAKELSPVLFTKLVVKPDATHYTQLLKQVDICWVFFEIPLTNTNL